MTHADLFFAVAVGMAVEQHLLSKRGNSFEARALAFSTSRRAALGIIYRRARENGYFVFFTKGTK